jgi:hypothetical protein
VAIERQYPAQETTLDSVPSWDSLGSQIDGIETEALFDVAAAPGVAVGDIGTVTVSAVFGSAVELTPNAERRETQVEASIPSDGSWDSLEGQIDGIESEALFLGRVDAEASGDIGTITISAIEGTATGETMATGSRGGRSYRWLINSPPLASPVGAWIRQREEEEILLLGQ